MRSSAGTFGGSRGALIGGGPDPRVWERITFLRQWSRHRGSPGSTGEHRELWGGLQPRAPVTTPSGDVTGSWSHTCASLQPGEKVNHWRSTEDQIFSEVRGQGQGGGRAARGWQGVSVLLRDTSAGRRNLNSGCLGNAEARQYNSQEAARERLLLSTLQTCGHISGTLSQDTARSVKTLFSPLTTGGFRSSGRLRFTLFSRITREQSDGLPGSTEEVRMERSR
ncbi:hypothetical protein EYF80_027887 [Liparis tanakae]|uniref:Uncharacterized protein n=1 Tax=Liparis tanakae TaxID=230148 RepID=A0A4Z2H8A4_9TELE|nr:hypothetical protein EYF80_027887 [Liparis tanakae]